MRAAFYECDITPPLGCNMPGYYCANPAEDVLERLYAKALVVEDGGNYAAIVALDTCEYVDEMTDIVTKRVYDYTGIPAESICIHVVHTHKGAPVEEASWTGQPCDREYRDVYYRLAADAIILAYQRLDTAEARFGRSTVPGIAFNRNYVRDDGKIVSFGVGDRKLDHMLAGVDEELPVMVFERAGKPIGALISFACHQDCVDATAYSSDYSGVMAQELKKVYGEDFVSLFMIGTAGDINHIANDPAVQQQRPPRWYREMGRRMAKQALEAIAEAKPVGGGVGVMKENIRIARRMTDAESTKKQLDYWLKNGGGMMRISNLVYYDKVNRDAYSDLVLQSIRIGNTCITVYPGEIYVNFGLRVKAESPFENNFVIENSNCFGGYIPTPEAFGENSDLYEISLCFGSRHVPEAGDIMTDRLLEMARELKK
ncbi:MAG: neutral/alkaline non-lysosomal ceramidase N-terminal domain-containing protein [Clostridia bacterium]|nr:neutral/alkaline non-lysosomal ceramidase N-terminal domain-containing protein [Clostridia bacterium]